MVRVVRLKVTHFYFNGGLFRLLLMGLDFVVVFLIVDWFWRYCKKNVQVLVGVIMTMFIFKHSCLNVLI